MVEVVKSSVYDAWLRGLRDRQAKARIGTRVRRLILGNPGQFRALKGGVREFKIEDGLHNPEQSGHRRSRAACCVANPRRSFGYGCGLRLAFHPDPLARLPLGVIQDILDYGSGY